MRATELATAVAWVGPKGRSGRSSASQVTRTVWLISRQPPKPRSVRLSASGVTRWVWLIFDQQRILSVAYGRPLGDALSLTDLRPEAEQLSVADRQPL